MCVADVTFFGPTISAQHDMQKTFPVQDFINNDYFHRGADEMGLEHL